MDIRSPPVRLWDPILSRNFMVSYATERSVPHINVSNLEQSSALFQLRQEIATP